jgi:hypothetical protein
VIGRRGGRQIKINSCTLYIHVLNIFTQGVALCAYIYDNPNRSQFGCGCGRALP